MLHGKSEILSEKATTLPQSRSSRSNPPALSSISIDERRQVLLLLGEWLAGALTDSEVEFKTRRFIVPTDELSRFRDCLSREEIPNQDFLNWWGFLR